MDTSDAVCIVGLLRSVVGVWFLYRLVSAHVLPLVKPYYLAKISSIIACHVLFLLCLGSLCISKKFIVVAVIFWCQAVEWGVLLFLLPSRLQVISSYVALFTLRSGLDVAILVTSLCLFGLGDVVFGSMFGVTIFLAHLSPIVISHYLLHLHDISMHSECYEQESYVSNSIFFSWFTSVLDVGHRGSLGVADLPPLPASCCSTFARDQLQYACLRAADKSTSSSTSLLTRALLLCYWREFFLLGVLKLLSVLLSFAGPVLLGTIVTFLEKHPMQHDLQYGAGLVLLLVACFVLSAVLNVQYSIRGNIIQTKMRNALTLGVYSRILSMPLNECISRDIGVGMATTLVQVDAAKISDNVMSLHELWSLPCQIIIAFLLLYYQVNVAFLAGVFIIIIMIPLNRFISLRIGAATESMLTYKDLRLRFLTESLRSIKTIKMSSMESFVLSMSASFRDKELTFLAVRKYLDAVCVFLWAALPLLVPAATFIVTILLHHRLTSAQIFTTLALLNMLIFPMNAYPWIINGLVEAHVSLRRVAKVLCNHTSSGWSCALGNHSYLALYRDAFVQTVHRQNVNASSTGIAFGSMSCNAIPQSQPRSDNVEVTGVIAGWSSTVCHLTNRSADSSMSHHHFMVTRSSLGMSGEDSRPSVNSISREDFVVGPVTLSLRLGEVCAVCGSVAYGKSTLLLALLGESFVSDASVINLPSAGGGGVSYCPQTPVLHCGTIKSNIVFDAPDDSTRYLRILHGCGLDVDFGTEDVNVGQEGNMVSGGQRLRIGVARALYHANPVVLLDDPFASLDARTAEHLMRFLVEEAKQRHRIIILTTHSIHLLPLADTIVFLDKPNEVVVGSYSSLLASSEAFRVYRQHDAGLISGTSATLVTESALSAPVSASQTDEHMERGYINSNIYTSYLRFMGIGLACVIAFSMLVMQVASNGLSIWFAYWASHTDMEGQKFIIITCIIVGINIIAATLRSFLFAFGGLRAAAVVYSKVARAVLNASISFFEENMVGRVVNRLGEDTYSIDDQLPFILNIAMAQTFIFLGTLVIICYSSPLVIAVLALVGWWYYRLQVYYRYSSRDLRRLDAVSRSPVASNLLDSIANAVSIRAMRLELKFELKMAAAMDAVERVALCSCIASQWLTMRLQLLGIVVTGSLAMLAVLCTIYDVLPVSASMFALALSFAFSLVNNVNSLVNSYAECEQEFVSVERVLEYISLRSEYENDGSVSSSTEKPSQCWKWQHDDDSYAPLRRHGSSFSYSPMTNNEDMTDPLIPMERCSLPSHASLLQAPASIVLSNLSMRYNDGTLALDDVTIIIPAGHRVAIIGRSGSGKSSLFRALLRMNDYTGSILVDSVELRDIPKKVLRRSVGLVAQDPYLFHGTVRDNIDPLRRHADTDVFRALQESGAATSLLGEQPLTPSTPKGLLNMDLKDGGASLSYGQRQLLAISRLILQRPQLILLDEATAHVDAATETIIFTALLRNFPTATMLIISHNLNRSALQEACHQVITLSHGKYVNNA